jgi:hypothetical protein
MRNKCTVLVADQSGSEPVSQNGQSNHQHVLSLAVGKERTGSLPGAPCPFFCSFTIAFDLSFLPR